MVLTLFLGQQSTTKWRHTRRRSQIFYTNAYLFVAYEHIVTLLCMAWLFAL